MCEPASEPVFQAIGEEAERLDKKEGGLTELDSVCAECRKDVSVLKAFVVCFQFGAIVCQFYRFGIYALLNSYPGQNEAPTDRDTVLQASGCDLVQLRTLWLLEQRTAAGLRDSGEGDRLRGEM